MSFAVADPGFPRGGGESFKGGDANLICWPVFPQKNHKNGKTWNRSRPDTPLRSANTFLTCVHLFKILMPYAQTFGKLSHRKTKSIKSIFGRVINFIFAPISRRRHLWVTTSGWCNYRWQHTWERRRLWGRVGCGSDVPSSKCWRPELSSLYNTKHETNNPISLK